MGDDTTSATIVTVNGQDVTLDDSTKLAVIKADDVTVTTNSGNDSVVSSGSNVTVDANSNTAKIVPIGGSMNIINFENASIQLSNADIAAALRNKAITFTATSDSVTATLSNRAQVTYTGDYVNLLNSKGESQKFSYVTANFENTSVENLLLYANPENKRSITTGNGDDTAFVGTGDAVNLGAGNNLIEISTTRKYFGENTAQIVLDTVAGVATHTTVKGFKANDFTDGDVAKFTSVENTQVNYKDGVLTFTNGNATLNMIDMNMTAMEDDAFVNVLVTDGGDTLKTSIARAGGVITVPSDVSKDNFATTYVGDTIGNSGVDLSEFEDTVSVTFSGNNGSGTFGNTGVVFRDIHSIKGGKGEHTLKGGAGQNDTLAAGTGKATIHGEGASSNDLLIGNSNQDSDTTFIYGPSDGNDTIQNFQFLEVTLSGYSSDIADIAGIFPDQNNDVKADVLNIAQNELRYVSEINAVDSDVVLTMSDGLNSITLKDAVDKRLKYSISRDPSNISTDTIIAKVAGDVITYDGITSYYVLTGYKSTLKVDPNFYDPAETSTINLKGKTNALGNQETITSYSSAKQIVVLDASEVVNRSLYLIGNDTSNTIIAGKGSNTLWGGSSTEGNDLLIGNNDSTDIFMYGSNEGSDTVENYGEDDIIDCYNLSASRISQVVTKDDNVIMSIRYSDNKVTIKYNDDVKYIHFKDYDGNDYTYNIGSQEFE